MGMLAGQVDGVIGVDTHRDSLAAAVIDPLGGIITHTSAPATDAGYQKLLEIAQAQVAGRRCWALEGTGSYGAGMASFLAERGEWVSRSTGHDDPPAARAKATRWMRYEQRARRWAVTT